MAMLHQHQHTNLCRRQLTARHVAIAHTIVESRAQVDALGGDALFSEPQLPYRWDGMNERTNMQNAISKRGETR
jgi:hypothetical protein